MPLHCLWAQVRRDRRSRTVLRASTLGPALSSASPATIDCAQPTVKRTSRRDPPPPRSVALLSNQVPFGSSDLFSSAPQLRLPSRLHVGTQSRIPASKAVVASGPRCQPPGLPIHGL